MKLFWIFIHNFFVCLFICFRFASRFIDLNHTAAKVVKFFSAIKIKVEAGKNNEVENWSLNLIQKQHKISFIPLL